VKSAIEQLNRRRSSLSDENRANVDLVAIIPVDNEAHVEMAREVSKKYVDMHVLCIDMQKAKIAEKAIAAAPALGLGYGAGYGIAAAAPAIAAAPALGLGYGAGYGYAAAAPAIAAAPALGLGYGAGAALW